MATSPSARSRQKPSLFPDHDVARIETPEPATPETFIPQAAERPPVRTPRMPKFEDLPMPAQAEIRQARGETEEEHPQKTRMSLLQRLANVGLGRRDEETEPPIAARASGPAMPTMPPLPERKPQRTVAQQIASQEPVSSMPAGRRRKVWTSTAARHLLLQRHRATTIWIYRLSCAASPTEVCYNSDDQERVPADRPGPFAFAGRSARRVHQATDIK